ncbi:MAG: hypothetical protein E7195_04660 [Peptococcaceae bacterium]|nr:hypothetical protein [Peptococcaceae bacterium]
MITIKIEHHHHHIHNCEEKDIAIDYDRLKKVIIDANDDCKKKTKNIPNVYTSILSILNIIVYIFIACGYGYLVVGNILSQEFIFWRIALSAVFIIAVIFIFLLLFLFELNNCDEDKIMARFQANIVVLTLLISIITLLNGGNCNC